MNGSQFFLTFPRCDKSKPELLESLKSLGRPVIWVLIVQEHHQDGGLHAHIAVRFRERLNIKRPSFFDPVGGQHGNYQTIKSVPKTLAYLRKFDTEPLTDGEVPSSAKSGRTTGVTDEIATAVQAGTSFRTLTETWPGFCMMNKRKIQEFEAFCSSAPPAPKSPWTGMWTSTHSVMTREIVTWCQLNLSHPTPPRPFGARQLYIHGPTLHNKTSFARRLEEFFRVYWVPTEENFDDFYSDSDFDLIVFDEYRGQRPVSSLNLWLDGSNVVFRKKGCQGAKRDNKPFIILSNAPLERWHNNDIDLETLSRRLTKIQLSSPIDLSETLHFSVPPAPTVHVVDSDSDLEGRDDP